MILGSSLFFTFARDYYDETEDVQSTVKLVDVTLIDMCHMEITEERDEGFLTGINECLKLMESIISIANNESILC